MNADFPGVLWYNYLVQNRREVGFVFRPNTGHQQAAIFDTLSIMNKKVKEKLNKSWAPIFYEEVFCKIDETPFAALYGTTGNPNFPVNILLSLELIKHIRNCSDAQLLEMYNFDFLVNYALGQTTLGERNLGERTLYNFRERLYLNMSDDSNREDVLFGQFMKLADHFIEKSNVRAKDQRVDTTMFMSNIKKSGRLALAFDVLIKGVKAIPEDHLTESLAKVLEPSFRTDTLFYSKAEAGESKLTQILRCCADALDILLPLPGKEEEKELLSRFIQEQGKRDADGKLVPEDKSKISSRSLQSAHDTDATFRRKAGIGHSGYVALITETCDTENEVQFITDYQVAPNVVSDVELIQNRIETIHGNTQCEVLYADGGFYSPDVNDLADKTGVAMRYTDMTGTKPRVRIPSSEFEIDESTDHILRCPEGKTPIRTSVSKSQSVAHYAKCDCENCPRQSECYAKETKKGFTVRISLGTIHAGQLRDEIRENKKENTSKRAGIEGTNSALKRMGMDKLKVRGLEKCQVVCALKMMAQNIKRFTKYVLGRNTGKNKDGINNGISVPQMAC
jgi:hypothetical protein